MKNIIFWGGYTTHMYELIISMIKLGYNVKVIRYTNSANEKRTERIPQYPNNNIADIIECNDKNKALQICRQYDKRTTLHINGCIKVSKSPLFIALKYLLTNGYSVISIPQEGFQLQGIKGKLNYLKWCFYLNLTWRRNMTAWGVTGLNAYRQFRYCGIKKKKLFQFLYVTKQNNICQSYSSFFEGGEENKKLKFIYVGAIDKRKNIVPVVKLMQKLYSKYDYEFNIYGSWSLDDELRQLVGNDKHIFYHGKQPYETVREQMMHADYLILPSLYDGYGAVGNEGLQSGCKLIISKQSGCSVFPRIHKELGYEFDAHDEHSLQIVLDACFAAGPLTISRKRKIVEWANDNISPDAIADYFEQIIDHYFNGQTKPIAPWMKY